MGNIAFLYPGIEVSAGEERGKASSLKKEVDHISSPLIGIPCRANYRPGSEQFGYGDRHAYVRAVESAGGLPMLMPVCTHLSELESLLPHLDGLLFVGGADIQPGLYGEQHHPALNAVDPELDSFEVALVTWALERDMPILGICRGMQLINVVLGGTLYQDISAQCPGALEHWRRDLLRTELAHQATIEKGSLMEQILRTRRLAINSLHHQAVKDPGKDIRICGRADDGIIELLEAPGYRFVLGVQGHPEEIYEDVPAFARLFQAFIRTCSQSSIEPVSFYQSVRTFQVVQPALAHSLFAFPISEKECKVSKAA